MPGSQQKLILLIENQPHIALATAERLQAFGYQVVVAHHVEEALALAASQAFDLILTDIDLDPGIDGVQAVGEILRQREVPVVFLTGPAEPESIARMREVTRYGCVPREAGDLILQTSLEMAFELFEAHQALRASDEKYRFFFDNQIYALYLFDLQTLQFLDVNEAYSRLSGYSREELLGGMRILDISAEPQATFDAIQQNEREGTLFIPLRYHRKKDGTVFPVEIVGEAKTWKDRRVMFAFVHDIIGRVQAETAVRESNQRLSLAMSQARLAHWEYDLTADCYLFNDRFYALHGSSAATEGGYRMTVEAYKRKFVPVEDHDILVQAANRVLAAGDPQFSTQAEHRILRADGELRHLSVSISLAPDEHGRPVKVFGASQDITERKLAEQALLASEERYRQQLGQTQAALAETQALYRLSRSLTVIDDLPSLLREVVEHAAEILLADRVTLIGLDLDRQQVNHFIRSGPGAANVKDVSFAELMEGLTGWALRERRPALSPGSFPDERESPQVQQRRRATNSGSIMVVPLQYRQQLLGTLTAINRPDEREFTTRDIERMVTMASQAAIAIANAQLYGELEQRAARLDQRARRLELINEFSLAVNQSIDLPAVLQTAVDSLRRALEDADIDRLQLALLDETGESLWLAAESISPAAQPQALPLPPGVERLRLADYPPLSALIAGRLAVHIPDFHNDPRQATLAGWAGAWPAHSLLLTPMIVRDQVIGALVCAASRPHTFSDEEVALVQTVANLAAARIEQAHLYEEAGLEIVERRRVEEWLRQSEGRYHRLFEDSPISLWEEDFSAVKDYFDGLRAAGVADFRTFFETHPQAVSHCAGLVRVLDVNQATLRMLVAEDKERLLAGLHNVFVPDSLRAFCQELIALAHGDAYFQSENQVHNTLDGQRRILNLQVRVAPGYEESLGKVLVSLVDITERKQAEAEIKHLLDEKELLLHEVHHRIKNNMSTISSLLALQAGQMDDPAAAHALEDAGGRVRSMMTIYDKLYRSDHFRQINLQAYLTALVEDIARAWQVPGRQVRLLAEIEAIEVPTRLSFPLGIVVNEWITNAFKYAFAGRTQGTIWVRVRRRGDSPGGPRLEVQVADDGAGLPPTVDVHNPQGFGLSLVQIMTEQLGGELSVGAVDLGGSGTVFNLSLPLKDELK